MRSAGCKKFIGELTLLSWVLPSLSVALISFVFGVVVYQPRLAQSVEHETLNLRVVGSSPTSGAMLLFFFPHQFFLFVIFFLSFLLPVLLL